MSNKQLNQNEVNWPVVNGETIDIAALKNKGYSVIVNQWREVNTPYVVTNQNVKNQFVVVPVSMPIYEVRRKGLLKQMRAKGGYTTVKVTKPGVNITGEAKCAPSDHFNKAVGIRVATQKAVEELIREKKI